MNPRRHPLFAVPCTLLLLLATCRGGPLDHDQAENPLYLDPTSRDFSAHPELLERIRLSPHGYFRFINVPFSREVCRRVVSEIAGTSSFNLHGDAHVEQYAVTDLGRGITDFDDSSTGPALIDLVRFGVSLRLAAEQQGFGEAADALFDEFLRGYRAALEDPSIEAAEPALARAEREKFRQNSQGYFEFVDSILEPMPAAEATKLEDALGDYVAAMGAEHPELDAGFFAVEKMGYLRRGIGSALDMKFLVRTRGASNDPLDDVVLEVKQVRDITSIDCIHTPSPDDPLRVLVGHSRIASEPFRYLGYARYRAHTFWVHAWVQNYSEIDIDNVTSAEELAEVAYDVGVQLGRGHVTEIAGLVEQQLRREQSRFIERNAEKVKQSCRELARLTVEAWEMFKAAL